MANEINLKEQDQVLSVIHKSEKGISYVDIHEAYFTQFGVRLGDQILEPIIDTLQKDKFVAQRAVPGADALYYTVPAANDFIATGAYRGKDARDKAMLEHELKMKELELELEVSKNKIFELENKKTHKGLYLSIIVVLLVALTTLGMYCHKISNNGAATSSDSLKINSQNASEPVKMQGGNENATQHNQDSTAAAVVDTIVSY